MNLIQRGDEVWLKKGRMEVHVLTYIDNAIHLQPIDPTMAKLFSLDVDEQGYMILETDLGPGNIT